MAYNVLKGNVQFINSDSGSIESMVDDYSSQTIAGIKTFSGILTASTGISSSAYFGDGAGLSGLDVAVNTYSNASNNRVLTSVNATAIQGESNLTFDGTVLTVTGNVSASVNVSGSGFYGSAIGLTSIPVNQFNGSISAASLNLGDTLDNDSGELIVDLSSSGGLESTATGLKVNPSVAVQKTSPVDADKFVIADSAASNVTKYITYGNLSTGIASGITTFPPNGSDGNVQVKNGSAFQGPNELNFNTTSNILTVTGKITASVHISSSQVFATSYFGNGSNLTGLATNTYNSFTTNFNVFKEHDLIGIVTTGSAITASLPSAVTFDPGHRVTFKDVSGSCSGSNHIVISASSHHTGDRIDGEGIVKIKAGFGAITIASDGVGSFYIVSTS
tara:strand:- start:1007 stop:2176 length:1170 start_codon:yes stop_codon:yes gene_type:complete